MRPLNRNIFNTDIDINIYVKSDSKPTWPQYELESGNRTQEVGSIGEETNAGYDDSDRTPVAQVSLALTILFLFNLIPSGFHRLSLMKNR